MPYQITAQTARTLFPKAPADIVEAFGSDEGNRVFDVAGINHTKNRLKYCLANTEHECAGFTIKNLTENINYSAEGMAKTWPSRFPGGAADVRRKYGMQQGWQNKAIDDIYGNRMGNRPGTHDGSTFIGRGGPQWTGRDGYTALAKYLKQLIPSLGSLTPEDCILYAVNHQYQPAVIAAFWMWKNLNKYADTGNFLGCVKAWNGGTIGMADRQAMMKGNDPILDRLDNVDAIRPVVESLPGNPPTPTPPKEVMDEATKTEKKVVVGSAGATAVGGASQAPKATTTQTGVPAKPLLPEYVAYPLLVIGAVAFIIGCILLYKKSQTVIANWN